MKMKLNHRKIIAAAVSLILLVLLFLWLAGSLSCEPKIAPGTKETPYPAAAAGEQFQVKVKTIPIEVETVGTVTARDSSDISSRIMAVIVKMNADAGDVVKKGQVLVELDARDVHARLSQAREALASAEASLNRADLDAGRIERLHEKNAATRQELDAAQAGKKMAQAEVEAARARVREAEVALSYTKIDSPISGQVIDRFADPGDMAVPGQKLLSLYTPSSLRLEIIVPERLRPKVEIGQTVKASIDSLDFDFEAQISEIVPASDISSRSFLLRAPLPEQTRAFPGMYGRIWIPSGSAEVLLVPPQAVRRVGQLEMVTVIQNGAAQTRAIKTGKTYPEGIEVLSGLQADEIVAIPQQKVDE